MIKIVWNIFILIILNKFIALHDHKSMSHALFMGQKSAQVYIGGALHVLVSKGFIAGHGHCHSGFAQRNILVR